MAMMPQKCTIFMAKWRGIRDMYENLPNSISTTPPYGKCPVEHPLFCGSFPSCCTLLLTFSYLIVLYLGHVFLQLDTSTGLQNVCLLLTGKSKKYIIFSFTNKWTVEIMERIYLILYCISMFFLNIYRCVFILVS